MASCSPPRRAPPDLLVSSELRRRNIWRRVTCVTGERGSPAVTTAVSSTRVRPVVLCGKVPVSETVDEKENAAATAGGGGVNAAVDVRRCEHSETAVRQKVDSPGNDSRCVVGAADSSTDSDGKSIISGVQVVEHDEDIIAPQSLWCTAFKEALWDVALLEVPRWAWQGWKRWRNSEAGRRWSAVSASASSLSDLAGEAVGELVGSVVAYVILERLWLAARGWVCETGVEAEEAMSRRRQRMLWRMFSRGGDGECSRRCSMEMACGEESAVL
ncbi:protein UL150A [Human betaherpesvirus 5]|uniref:Protein UL150A n=1 Tax=Human cytomegalovirus TaxID=10359 RepID=A0A0G2U0N8_HCMV|nr:protein UL150A [Human betaherpesvirus 5]